MGLFRGGCCWATGDAAVAGGTSRRDQVAASTSNPVMVAKPRHIHCLKLFTCTMPRPSRCSRAPSIQRNLWMPSAASAPSCRQGSICFHP